MSIERIKQTMGSNLKPIEYEILRQTVSKETFEKLYKLLKEMEETRAKLRAFTEKLKECKNEI